jgi:endo-1,4-beta-D-glucanase Y
MNKVLRRNRKFNRILNDPQNQYWTQLEPGMPLSKWGSAQGDDDGTDTDEQSLTTGECCMEEACLQASDEWLEVTVSISRKQKDGAC